MAGAPPAARGHRRTPTRSPAREPAHRGGLAGPAAGAGRDRAWRPSSADTPARSAAPPFFCPPPPSGLCLLSRGHGGSGRDDVRGPGRPGRGRPMYRSRRAILHGGMSNRAIGRVLGSLLGQPTLSPRSGTRDHDCTRRPRYRQAASTTACGGPVTSLELQFPSPIAPWIDLPPNVGLLCPTHRRTEGGVSRFA